MGKQNLIKTKDLILTLTFQKLVYCKNGHKLTLTCQAFACLGSYVSV
jgi:hypothetical protein